MHAVPAADGAGRSPADAAGPLDDAALDRLFRTARTHTHWLDRPVSEDTLRAVAELMKWGPTSANCCPARIVFAVSAEAKERLKPHLSAGNTRQTLEAPATAVIGYDTAFYDKLSFLYPHDLSARGWFAGKPAVIEETGLRNSSLQAGYLILTARALGLDCGPMSGFDKAGVEAAFFPGGLVRANMLVNRGYGDPAKLHPRSPRFPFEAFCSIA
jgi:3-hydroxypropanoate dehydrogenase